LLANGFKRTLSKVDKKTNNILEPFTDPLLLLPFVKKIIQNPIKVSDKNYSMIDIPKKDFVLHINERYKGLSFSNKLISLFFPKGGEKKIRFNDF
jgi:hypothetical protein